MSLPREFALIGAHFRPLAHPAARNLADDAAVLAIPGGRELVVSTDVMNEGTHFLADTPPSLLARKLLRVNLSDLAAMGAAPLGYLVTIAVPAATPDAWFAAFAEGLAHDQAEFGIAVLGGDCTSIAGPISLGLTILGTVPAGQAIGRGSAAPGDGIWLSGTVGDAALGLQARLGRLADPTGWLGARYDLPTPRLGLADGLAHAAIDVSDGLFAELGHLCRESRLGAAITSHCIPLSEAAIAAGHAWREAAERGGDDYELLMAIPPTHEAALRARALALNVPVTRLGHFLPPEAGVTRDGVPLDTAGWSHF